MKYSLAQVALVATLMIGLLSMPVGAYGALIAIEDNNVLKSQPTTPQANGTSFSIKEASTAQTNTRIGYIKFDLSSIAVSSLNEGVFTITSVGSQASSYTLRAYALKTGATNFNWSQAAITYDTRPALSATAPYVDTAQASIVGTDYNILSGAAGGTAYSFSFANLENYRQSDNTITFVLLNTVQSSGTPSFSFATSENATVAIRPTLEVTAVPEPATTALLGLGLFGFCVWQRRK